MQILLNGPSTPHMVHTDVGQHMLTQVTPRPELITQPENATSLPSDALLLGKVVKSMFEGGNLEHATPHSFRRFLKPYGVEIWTNEKDVA